MSGSMFVFDHFLGFHTRSWFGELNPPRIAQAFEIAARLRRTRDLLCKWPLEIVNIVAFTAKSYNF